MDIWQRVILPVKAKIHRFLLITSLLQYFNAVKDKNTSFMLNFIDPS
jgi:hypothetical protein